MPPEYAPLNSVVLSAGVTYAQPPRVLPPHVNLDSPAQEAMTDLQRVRAFTIHPEAKMNESEQVMLRRAIRMLFVVDDKDEVQGLITASDIKNEKPMLFVQRTGTSRSDILVRDIMTPRDKLEAMNFADVQRAKVGNIVATLLQAGRQHALALDMSGAPHVIRGIFSINQIASQLGMKIDVTEVAKTFAEIEAMLMHN